MAAARRRAWLNIVGITAAVAVVACPLATPKASAAPVVGTALTFGANDFGQLGDGSSSTTTRATPGPATGMDDIVDIGGGREHIIALHSDGTVSTWGSDFYGQLGNGSVDQSNHNQPVDVPGLTDVVDVDDGHYHSLALESDGTAWAWGFGSLGQLGNSSTATRVHSPVRFGTMSNVAQVFGGRDMSYVVLDDGTVWCSGGNANGECGDASYVAKIDSPVQVPGLTSVIDMAGGRNHALALKSNGTVWTWGLNSDGQLGDGTRTKHAHPEQVAGLSNVVDVAAGADHSVAVTADGHVYTWGWGGRGQLGLGDENDRLVPTEVPGISDAAISEAGRDHTLIITTDGHLVTWGENANKQTGDNTSALEVTSPYTVPGLDNVIAAAGGQAYSVVLQANSTPPPPLLEDGFDSGLSGWVGGVNFTLDNSEFPATGSAPSLRAVLAGQRSAAQHGLPAGAASGACAAIQTRLESSNSALPILKLAASDGTPIARLIIGKDRRLKVRADGAGVVRVSSVLVPLNQWHELGVCVHDNGTSDQLAATFDGNSVGQWTLNNGSLSIEQLEIGVPKKVTATFNLDDVVVTAN
ncbi:MAG TPA: hypothetical protein VMT88_06425 [Actinomycetes bacterium]|nr:hypothetical protein [Actinomycetes bacterium]